MSQQSQLEAIETASQASFPKKLGIYAKLSGPGWIQAAVTLGGGSLVGALYLGVIGGYQFMWLQPLAMLCGVIMLSAISHITLSSEERPFVSAKKHVSPTLAWGWLIATVIANIVFCAAQFSLGTDAVQSNLGILPKAPYVITAFFAIVSISLLWLSRQDGKASQLIDKVLKILVAIVVLAFLGVVLVLAAKGAVDWGSLFKGLIPDFTALFKPTHTYSDAISATGEQSGFWTKYIAENQRDVIIGAFGSAVGINMTFLLPYSIKAKGWGKKHRELSRFDLALGLFVPFILATSFLVIATSSQFHAQKDGVHSEASYTKVIDARLAQTTPDFKTLDDEKKTALRDALPQAEKDLGVMLAKRNSKDLASSLEPFLGKYAQLIFGIGVLAMAVSTMIVLMLMNGYAISEALGSLGKKSLLKNVISSEFDISSKKSIFMLGAALPAISGFLSPVLWTGGAKTALVVPAAVIATTLLPIAYLIFLLMMNSKKVLGEDLPRKRSVVNTLMIIATSIATFACLWNLKGKFDSPNDYSHYFGLFGLIGVPVLFLIGILGFIKRNKA